MLALALAVRDERSDLAFATGANARQVLGDHGVRLFPVGARVEALRQERFQIQRPSQGGDQLTSFARREIFAGLRVEVITPEIIEICTSWRPDIIVRAHNDFAAWLAAEKLGIPHVSVEEWSSGSPSTFHDLIRDPLNQWLAAYGLDADPGLATLSRYLTLVPFPPSLRSSESPFSSTFRRIKPLVLEAGEGEALPEWFDALPHSTIVHVTLGTLSERPEVLRVIVEALADEPVSVVVATGRAIGVETFGHLPANVRLVSYIPHSKLLPRCDAVVSHGGAGTLIASVEAGLPMLLIPLFGDQPLNAAQAEAVGVASVLLPSDLTPERVKDAVLALLREDAYRTNLARLAQEVSELPDHNQVGLWLARVARDEAPLPEGV